MFFCQRLARHAGTAFLALFVLCAVVFPPSLASSFVQAKPMSTPKPTSTAQPTSTTQNVSFVKKFGSKYTMDVIARLDNYIRSKNIKNVLQPLNCVVDTLTAYFDNNNCIPDTSSPNKIVAGVNQKLRTIFDALLHEAYGSTGGKCGVEKSTKKRGTMGGESCLLELVAFINSNVGNWSKKDISALHEYIEKILKSKDVYKGACPAKTVKDFLTNKLCSSVVADNPENYSAAAALWRTIQHQTYYFTKGVCGYSAKAKNAGDKFMERGETLCGLMPNYQNLTASQLNEFIPISSKVTLGTWNATLNCISSAIPVLACVAKIPDEAVRGLIQTAYFSNASNGSAIANFVLANFAGFKKEDRDKFFKVVEDYEKLEKEKKIAITEADREKLRAKYNVPDIKRYHENKKTVEVFISYSSQMGPVFVLHWITNNVVIALTERQVLAGTLQLSNVIVSPKVSAKVAGASGTILSALVVCEKFKPCNTNLNPLYDFDQITRNGEEWKLAKISAIVIPVIIGFFCQSTPPNRYSVGCAKDVASNINFEFGILRKMSSKTCYTCPRDSNRTLQAVFMESTFAISTFGFIQNSFTNINKINQVPGAIKTILTNICKFLGQECNPEIISNMEPNAARTNKRGVIIISLVTAIVAFTTTYHSTKEVMDLYASKVSIKNCISNAPCAAALLRSANDLRRDAVVGNLIRFASGVVEAEKKPQEKNFFASVLAFVNSAIMKIGSQHIKTLDSFKKELEKNRRNICDFYKIDSLPTNNKSAFVIQGTDFYPFRDGCVVIKHWSK